MGLFAAFSGPADALPRLPDPSDESLPDETRARAYLDANCSQCHRPGGSGRGELDLRFSAPGSDLLAKRPLLGDLGIAGARILRPGDPARSLLYLRPASPNLGRMPPLASTVIDSFGIGLLQRWITGLEATAIAASADALPRAIWLYPNFPNPFNASTTIAFDLNRPTPVRLTVYNLGGQALKTLLARPLPAGHHRAMWDGSDRLGRPVASGLYLLRLATPETVRTGKVLLLK